MTLGSVARETRNDPASIAFPIRRVKSGERRHEVDSSIVFDRLGESFDVRALLNQAEVVTQPLHQGSRDRDAPFQRVVGGLVPEFVGQRCEQPATGMHQLRPGVHKQEASGPVSVFSFSGPK